MSHRPTCLLSLRQDSKCHVYSNRLGTFKLHWTWHLLHHTLADVDRTDSTSAADQSYAAGDVVYASLKTRNRAVAGRTALPLKLSIRVECLHSVCITCHGQGCVSDDDSFECQTFRTIDFSYYRRFVPFVDFSYHGRFVPWTFRTFLGLFVPFVPRTFRTVLGLFVPLWEF